MSQPLLLDEMFSNDIAQQLRAKGYDVVSVVADPALAGLPDDQILAYATTEGGALVTANIKDFAPLDTRYRAADQSHAGLIPVSTKTSPRTAASHSRSQPPSLHYSVARPRSSRAKSYSSRGAKSDTATARAPPRPRDRCLSPCLWSRPRRASRG
jgi:hypothetical protein